MPDEPVGESSTPETEPAAPAPETAEDVAILPEGESAPQEESAPEGDKPDGESVSAPEAAKQTEGTKAERRIKQLTAQNKQMERRLQELQYQRLNPQPPAMKPPVLPKLEDFETIDEYQQALQKYDNDARVFAVLQDRQAQQQRAMQEQQQRQMTEARETWEKRAQRVTKTNPEFNPVEALARVEPNAATDGFLLDSEVGPELLDYLDSNPDEAERIREMSPYQAVRELVKLEDKLTLSVKGIKAKPSLVKPPSAVRGRESEPSKPKAAYDVLYG